MQNHLSAKYEHKLFCIANCNTRVYSDAVIVSLRTDLMMKLFSDLTYKSNPYVSRTATGDDTSQQFG